MPEPIDVKALLHEARLTFTGQDGDGRSLLARKLADALEAIEKEREALREACEPLAESEAFRRAAAMDDPGRVPCFITTEGARALIAALAAREAPRG